LLRSEPIVFNGVELRISGEEAINKKPGGTGKPTKGAPNVFVPRTAAASKPRAGIGSKKTPGTRPPTTTTFTSAGDASSSSSHKGQDDFRKMLG
jgi:squamous cell carcinoma antigen recognized by T-cells 3